MYFVAVICVEPGYKMYLFGKRPVRFLIMKNLITFVWIRSELIQRSSFMHAGSPLGYPPPKTIVSVRLLWPNLLLSSSASGRLMTL
jgi:hypothetical protein